MSYPFAVQEITALESVISAPRFATYLRARSNNKIAALSLYQWNLEISAALFVPLQVLEVSTRNVVAEALSLVHGANWPWSDGFIRSLPSPSRHSHYDPKKDLRSVPRKQPTTGKVISELKFAFWQHIFTQGQDTRLWLPHLYTCFPSMPIVISPVWARSYIHDALQEIRNLRNRIAHHEPIYLRDLSTEHRVIRQIIEWRSLNVKGWLDTIDRVPYLIKSMPVFP